MSKSPRRYHTPEQKAALLRRHLVEKVPVSQICSEIDLQPSVFYGWLQQLLERAHVALASPTSTLYLGGAFTANATVGLARPDALATMR